MLGNTSKTHHLNNNIHNFDCVVLLKNYVHIEKYHCMYQIHDLLIPCMPSIQRFPFWLQLTSHYNAQFKNKTGMKNWSQETHRPFPESPNTVNWWLNITAKNIDNIKYLKQAITQQGPAKGRSAKYNLKYIEYSQCRTLN